MANREIASLPGSSGGPAAFCLKDCFQTYFPCRFLPYRGFLRGLVWTMQLGVCLSSGVCRASSQPSASIRKAPMEPEGWDLPPLVVRDPLFSAVSSPGLGPAGGIAAQEINTDRAQRSKYSSFKMFFVLSYNPSSYMNTLSGFVRMGTADAARATAISFLFPCCPVISWQVFLPGSRNDFVSPCSCDATQQWHLPAGPVVPTGQKSVSPSGMAVSSPDPHK